MPRDDDQLILPNADPQTAALGTTVVPIQTARWLDERGGCSLAHVYLHERGYAEGEPRAEADDLPNFRACQMYERGRCRLNGREANTACVFTQLADDEGWQVVRQRRLIPGLGAAFVADYADLLALSEAPK
jgi:hypothetical protein